MRFSKTERHMTSPILDIESLIFQMPLNRANCGILSVMSQLKNVNDQYLPVFFRYSMVIYFCRTYHKYKVHLPSLQLSSYKIYFDIKFLTSTNWGMSMRNVYYSLQKYLELELTAQNLSPQQWALNMLLPDTYLDTVAMITIRNMIKVIKRNKQCSNSQCYVHMLLIL